MEPEDSFQCSAWHIITPAEPFFSSTSHLFPLQYYHMIHII